MGDDISLIIVSSFPHSSSCQCHCKESDSTQGLIGVADIRLRFITVKKKMSGTRAGCLSWVITSICVLSGSFN